ncbi:MAG: succinate dehydrogenase/fumarate reductase iron-sulfur subunit [Smithellaceae bacterium]
MKVTILKYDPTKDAEPYYKTYEVPWKKHMTVLEAIVYIHEHHEPVAFDYSCRGRVCGRCAMTLNGEPTMACFTHIKDQDNKLEPLRGYPVIRDFVVDKSKLHDAIGKIQSRIIEKPVTDREAILAPMDPVLAKKIGAIEWCCRCLCCNAACPVVNDQKKQGKFIGPVGIIASALRYYDPFDEGDRVTEAVQNGLFECIMCGRCNKVCPADEIDHLKIYSELRKEATERGLKPKKKR